MDSNLGFGLVFQLENQFSSVANDIQRSMGGLGASTDKLQAQITTATNQMHAGFALLGGGIALATPLVLATKQAMNFEEGLAKINTTAQLSKEGLAKLGNELLSVGANATSDVANIPNAFEKIISQTGEVATSMDIIKAATAGARAGFTEVDTVAGALAQTLSIVGSQNTNAQTVIDTLFAAKRVGAGEFRDFANYLPTLIAAGSNLGYSFQQTAGIFAYFTGKGQDAANSVTLIQNAFSALQKTDISAGFKKFLGVDFFEGGKLKDVPILFAEIQAKLAGLNQQQRADLLEKAGLRDVQARNAFAILGSDVTKLKEAIAATSNPAGELASALKNGQTAGQQFDIAMNRIKAGMIELGLVLLPIVADAATFLSNIFGVVSSAMSALASNPIGRAVIYLTTAIAGLSIALGTLLIVQGAAKMGAIYMASAFTGATQAAILETIATHGAAAGFRAMAVATWSAITPLLPFIAIGAAVVAIGYGIYAAYQKAVDSFDNFTDKASGVTLFFARMGGYISTIKEVWNTWNGLTGTFSLTEQTVKKLQNLGIYDTAMAIATWGVRIKTFFGEMWQTISAAANQAWGVISSVWERISSATGKLFESLGFDIGKNTSDLKAWANAGKIIGNIIVAAIGAIFTPFLLAYQGVQMLISAAQYLGTVFVSAWNGIKAAASATLEFFQPITNILGGGLRLAFSVVSGVLGVVFDILKAIGTVIYDLVSFHFTMLFSALSALGSAFVSIFAEIWAAVSPAISLIGSAFLFVGKIIVGVFGAAFGVISNIMGGIWAGVKLLATNIYNIFTTIVDSIMSVINGLQGAWDFIMGMWDSFSGGVASAYDTAKAGFEQNVNMQPAFVNTQNIGLSAARYQGNTASPIVVNQGAGKSQPVVVESNLYLDGDKIYRNIEQRIQENVNRN